MTDFSPPETTILIVDDSPINITVLQSYLNKSGYNIVSALSGKEALEILQTLTPNLIMLDIMMPGIDGFEVCQQIKANPLTKDIPVIFMTALTDVSDKLRGFEVGAIDYITKPIQYRELSARLSIHLRMQHLTQTLQKTNADKDKLFSIIAHDLKGPFMPLMGTSDYLAEIAGVAEAEQIKELAHSINHSAHRIYNLLENLLDWGRMQTGHLEAKPQTVDVAEIANTVVSLLEPIAIEKEIALQNNIPPHLTVYADMHMLSAIIRNLTANALKFTPIGGKVIISAMPTPPSQIQITIADSGVGMTSDQIETLLSSGAYFTTPGTEQEKGSGLGFSICQEMVAKNNGRLWIESTPGQGTSVHFTLPTSAA